MKKSRICKQVWTKQYYLAVKHSNIMKYEQSRNPVSFSTCIVPDPLDQLTALPMQYTRSHWFPAFGLDLPLMFKVHKIW